jgi:undecaprenyl-diphosphatase
MEKKKKILLELISLKVVLVSLLFIVSLFIFALIAREAVLENEKAFDDKVFAFFASISTPAFIKTMEVFTFFGSSQFLLPAYLVLIGYFFWEKKIRYGLDIAIIGISSTALMFALKQIFHRQRPDLPIIKALATYSFPSGHTLSTFIFCSIFIFILKNGRWKPAYKWIVSTLLIIIAITIGASRIALKAHYPTDVIASFCLGVVWVILSLSLLRAINRKYMINKSLTSVKT